MSRHRIAVWGFSVLAVVSWIGVVQGQPAGFVEEFDGPGLDGAWTQGGDLSGHPGVIAGTYDISDAHGAPGVKLSRVTPGTLSSYTQEIELVVDPMLLMGAGGTQTDFKLKSFGPDGFVEVVLNSFGHMRLWHNDADGGAGYLNGGFPAVDIGYMDGDILNIKTVYDQGSDTIDVSYSLNGEPAITFYTGGGIDGPIGDLITSFVEVEVFKWGDDLPDQSVVSIDRWSLLADGVTGDFNSDGSWDCLDINALTDAVATASGDLSFDMNGDGSVTFADVTDAGVGWLAVGGANNPGLTGGNPFLSGDANLDGNVDGQDFLAWNGNKFTSSTHWCDGNFTGDATVDGQDFLAWNGNKFTSSDGVAAVPEPAAVTGWLAVLAAAATARRRKGR